MQFHDFIQMASSPVREAGLKPGVAPSLDFGNEHFIRSCFGSTKAFPITPFRHFKTLITVSSLQFGTRNFYVEC